MLRQVGLVDESNDKIVEVGLTRLMNITMDWIFSVVCAAIMGNMWVGIVFEISYALLRIYAGGYHAKNKKSCFYLTYISTLLCIISAFFVPFSIWLIVGLTMVSMVIFIKLVPVQSENKPLNRVEVKIYRRNALCIAFGEVLLLVCFLLSKKNQCANVICATFVLVAIGLIAGAKNQKSSLYHLH
ncbi:MAG: accessory gene regulator B family protein [Eubacteriales bacterium]|nr:accessory gene regulator B family protein [Eubacteriales bacterium]